MLILIVWRNFFVNDDIFMLIMLIMWIFDDVYINYCAKYICVTYVKYVIVIIFYDN